MERDDDEWRGTKKKKQERKKKTVSCMGQNIDGWPSHYQAKITLTSNDSNETCCMENAHSGSKINQTPPILFRFCLYQLTLHANIADHRQDQLCSYLNK